MVLPDKMYHALCAVRDAFYKVSLLDGLCSLPQLGQPTGRGAALRGLCLRGVLVLIPKAS